MPILPASGFHCTRASLIFRIVADRLESRSSELAGVLHGPFLLRRVRARAESRDAVVGKGLKNTPAGAALMPAESGGLADATQDWLG